MRPRVCGGRGAAGVSGAGAPGGEARIRDARVEDARGITEIHVRGWQSAYRGILPQALLDALDVEERTASRREALLEPRWPDTANWVIEVAGRIVGWASSGRARNEDLDEVMCRELYAIYLDPDEIGNGHGRALMERALEDACARGCTEMTMWVLVGNERAQRFYRAAGFVPDARREPEPFRDTGASMLRMSRALP